VPLTQNVTFQGVLEKGNRVQIPKLILWQFKIETDQVLKVGVNARESYRGWQFFYAKMDKQGRILVPKLTLSVMAREENQIFVGQVLEVILQPA